MGLLDFTTDGLNYNIIESKSILKFENIQIYYNYINNCLIYDSINNDDIDCEYLKIKITNFLKKLVCKKQFRYLDI